MTASDDYDRERFELAYYGVFPQPMKIDTETSIKFLGTVSHVIALDAETRERFFSEVREIMDGKLNGVGEGIVGHVLTVLKAK